MKVCPQCAGLYPDDYAVCPRDSAQLHGSDLWHPGTVIHGKYKILVQIGEGGMATVYKAHHLLLDEPRAIKVILPDLARDGEFVKRFQNEAIMARKLNHPNAVRVDDLDIAEDGRPFIAMEFVAGDTLKAVIEQFGALPAPMVLDVSTQLCAALDAAHKIGLVHRDIKPENIVLIPRKGASPLAKILDFGIARLREEPALSGRQHSARHNSGLTQTGIVIGTPEYMSPEQALGKRGDQLDGRSDLYSLGIVMYQMLTGELPFKAETTVEMLLHHVKTRPKSPRELKPHLWISDTASAIVMKALRKDRDRRFSSAADMGRVIREARAQLQAAPQGGQALPQTLVGKPPGVLSSAGGARATGPRSAGQTPAKPTATPASIAAPGFSRTIAQGFRSPITRGVLAGVAVLALVVAAIAFSRHSQPGETQNARAGRSVVAGTNQIDRSALKKPSGTAAPSASKPQDRNHLSQSTPNDLAQKPSEADARGTTLETSQPQGPQQPASPPMQSPRIPHLGGKWKIGAAQARARIPELNSWGESLCKQGSSEEGVRIFRAVLRIDPGNQRASRGIEECTR